MLNIRTVVEPLIIFLSLLFVIGYSTPATLLDHRMYLWIYFGILNFTFLLKEKFKYFDYLIYILTLVPILLTQSMRSPFVVVSILGLCLHLERDWKSYLSLMFTGFGIVFLLILQYYSSWPVTDLLNQTLAGVLVFLASLIIRFLFVEFREMMLRLELSQRLAVAGTMAQGLAHEIKNPLTSISGLIEIVSKEVKENPDLVDIIMKEIKRLNLLLHDFNNFANPSLNQIQQNSWNNCIEEVVLIVNHSQELKEKNIIIQIDTNEKVYGYFDYEKMKQVLLNILSNAISFSPKDGSILIQLKKTNLLIADQGSGFDKESKANLFVPFKTKRKGGTGLGLATAKTILNAHGFDIRLDKSSPSYPGANFVINFEKGISL